jgi:hypothetical protein
MKKLENAQLKMHKANSLHRCFDKEKFAVNILLETSTSSAVKYNNSKYK